MPTPNSEQFDVSTTRLEAFSDGVIAASLGALMFFAPQYRPRAA